MTSQLIDRQQKCPDCQIPMETKVHRRGEDSDGYYTYEPYIVQCPKCKLIEEAYD